MSTSLVRALAVVATGAAVALTAPAGPVVAAPPERGEFDTAYGGAVQDFCGRPGLDVLVEGTLTGTFQIGERGRDGMKYWLDHTRFAEVITNTATGEQVRSLASSVGKDLHVTDNGDGTLTVVFLATGNSTVWDASGRAIARDPGQARLSFLLDHSGTPTDKADDVFLEPPTLVKGSTGRSDDMCAAMVDALS